MARAARGKGEGSLYCRSDGRWVAQVEAGRSPSGKRRYARAVRRTKPEAREALKELVRQRDDGVIPDRSRTVEAYLDWWADNVIPGTMRGSTEDFYRKMIRLYITPYIGTKRLGNLTPQHVVDMLRELERKGFSPRTRSTARGVLVRALGWAVRTGMLNRNVAQLATGPREAKARVDDALTADEARAVLDAAKNHRLGALATVVLRLGLRRGEALALRWDHIDFDAGELTVTGTLKRRKGVGLFVDEAKTEAANRTIPLVAGTAAALRDRKRRQAEERLEAGPLWREEGWVFTSARGGPVDPAWATAVWHEWTKAAGLGLRRMHAARHTCATLLLADGVPLETVSAILGHSSIRITADIYARVGADAKRRALAQLDELLGEGKS